MIVVTVRPSEMEHIGNIYYPMGLPSADDPKETFDFTEYYDKNYNKYAICYTKKQVENIAVFSPYIPLHLSIP